MTKEANEEKVASKEFSHPTNQHDVEVAKVKAELEQMQFELGAKLIEKNEAKKYKAMSLEKIISSTERITIGAMILGGVTFVAGKRYEMINLATDLRREM